MTHRELATYEKALLSERQRIVRTVTNAARDLRDGDAREVNTDPFDSGDGASSSAASEIDAAVASRETELLGEVDDALRRLYQTPDRFGRCDFCGAEIPRGRLDVLPWTDACPRHAALATARISESNAIAWPELALAEAV